MASPRPRRPHPGNRPVWAAYARQGPQYRAAKVRLAAPRDGGPGRDERQGQLGDGMPREASRATYSLPAISCSTVFSPIRSIVRPNRSLGRPFSR